MRTFIIFALALSFSACGMQNQASMGNSAGSNGMAGPMSTPDVDALPAVVENGITIRDPWARTGTEGDNSAVYMVIENANSDDTLLSVSGVVAAAVELHTVINDNGMMKMIPVEGGIPVLADATQILKPGSFHIMLIGLTNDLKSGDTFPLALTYANAGQITVSIEVR